MGGIVIVGYFYLYRSVLGCKRYREMHRRCAQLTSEAGVELIFGWVAVLVWVNENFVTGVLLGWDSWCEEEFSETFWIMIMGSRGGLIFLGWGQTSCGVKRDMEFRAKAYEWDVEDTSEQAWLCFCVWGQSVGISVRSISDSSFRRCAPMECEPFYSGVGFVSYGMIRLEER